VPEEFFTASDHFVEAEPELLISLEIS